MAELSEIDDLLASFGFAISTLSSPAARSEEGRESVTRPEYDEAPASEIRRLLPGDCTAPKTAKAFLPHAPDTLEQTGLQITELTDIILKYMVYRGRETGFNVGRQLGLKFPLIDSVLKVLKSEHLITYRGSVNGADYVYELTRLGRERAMELSQRCTYFGAAPVPLRQYVESVRSQSISNCKPSLYSIRAAFADLTIRETILSSVGQAIHSGRGMFLYGPAGNGKTSIAERITKSFGDTIWVPKSITAGGEIVRVYDPHRHKLVRQPVNPDDGVDGRWVLIERPTITAGGELRMDNLEVSYIHRGGIGEAPLQLKANCGTLLIDDFGRQRISIDELLNRWIVPLEQRHDFLHLESGRTIQVPFDQLIIFSSNLEPRDLVDEAFLRRIPYKIHVGDPSQEEFRELFLEVASQANLTWESGVLDDTIQTHYVDKQRPFRFCHPRDLVRQIDNRCTLLGTPRIITQAAMDQAIENYFSMM